MPALNPCCGVVPLKTASKVIAICQVVISLLALVAVTIPIVRNSVLSDSKPKEEVTRLGPRLFKPEPKNIFGANNTDNVEMNKGQDVKGNEIIVWILFGIFFLGMLIVLIASVNLFKGARDKLKMRCKLWVAINIILFLLLGILFGFLCFYEAHPFILCAFGLGTIIHGYFIFVVHAFTQELES